MNTVPFYQINSFTSEPFKGNPAGVVPLESWLPDTLMQRIAAEANLSETAFVVPEGDRFGLRWFTPTVEVDLCGHATLAAGHVLLKDRIHGRDEVVFETKSGTVKVRRGAHLALQLDFPIWEPVPVEFPAGAAEAIGAQPHAAFRGDTDLFLVLGSERELLAVQPNSELVRAFQTRGVIVTAPGESCDFVSRAFFPNVGVPEDPVTGSIHCALAPYWAGRLGKKTLHARQLSARSGVLVCTLSGNRVQIEGDVVEYLCGQLTIPKVP